MQMYNRDQVNRNCIKLYYLFLGATPTSVAGSTTFWVGIKRQSYLDPFLMLTTPSNPELPLHSPTWNPGQPNGPSSPPYQNCISSKDFFYYDSDCAVQKPFLCEIPGHKSYCK